MKNVIATRYGVDTVMSEETRISVEVIKKGESDKRKKAWEDKEGPPSKKQKKIIVVEDDKGDQGELRLGHLVCVMMFNRVMQNGVKRRSRRKRNCCRKLKRRPSGWPQRKRRKSPSDTQRKTWIFRLETRRRGLV